MTIAPARLAQSQAIISIGLSLLLSFSVTLHADPTSAPQEAQAQQQPALLSDPEAVDRLLRGNSLYGRYDALVFRQYLRADGTALVNFIGAEKVHEVPWYINAKAEYCERWPDHESCFGIGLHPNQDPSAPQQLLVKAGDKAKIQSFLYHGEIPLDMQVTLKPPHHELAQ